MRRIIFAIVVVGTCLASVVPASAAVVPPGFEQDVVVDGLEEPTAVAVASDGTVFVTEKPGRLVSVPPGGPSSLELSLPVATGGERGLIGLALDPAFPAVPRVFLHYTATTPTIHNRVSSFDLSSSPPSETVLLDLPTLGSENHNGGAIHVGPDGLLYIAVGDNGLSANAPDLASPLGKILRIGLDGTVPSDNPFVTTPGAEPRVWALGLRNPYTFAFDPVSERMLINDVGQSSFEEVNLGVVGGDYGWPFVEGPTADPDYESPLYSYGHSDGCAVVGAAWTTPGSGIPDDFLFADFCSGWIRSLDVDWGVAAEFVTGLANPSDLAVSAGGDLYIAENGSGRVLRISASAPPPAVPESPITALLIPVAMASIGVVLLRVRTATRARVAATPSCTR